MTRPRNTRREFLAGAGALLAHLLAPSQLFACTQDDGARSHRQLLTPALSQASQHETTTSSAAKGPIRGLMLDAARVPESMDYYKRVVGFCAEWGLNTIQFRLTDDQGSALRFRSVADLVTHRHAFTADQLRDLVAYAQQHGIELIPEVESFGHTGFITRASRYAHLLDTDVHGSSEFSGIIPVNDETRSIFEKLYREVASTFPSKYLHGGCDEVNWGGSAQSRDALRSKSRVQIWAEYLNTLNQTAKSMDKQFIVWGDFVVHKEPAILPMLSKDIVIMDWNYAETSSAELRKTLSAIGTNGSRAIGAPALSCYRWGARVGWQQLRNIDAFAQAYLESSDPAALGVMLTNWIPSRYVQNSIWDGFAYAAVAFRDGSERAQSSAFRQFIETHYEAKWNKNWDRAFHILYEAAPQVREHGATPSTYSPLIIPWSGDAELAGTLKAPALPANPFTPLRSALEGVEPSVRKNLDDLRALQLSAEYLEWAYERQASVQELAALSGSARAASDKLIQTIARRDRDLHIRLVADWDRGRPSDAEAKSQPVFGLWPKDQLLFQWSRATHYSTSLADAPERFHQIIEAKRVASS